MNQLITVAQAAELIRRGVTLSLAGPESALDKLPAGNWIAGTIPYFMTEEGGTVVTDDRVFATDVSAIGEVSVTSYDADSLASIASNAPENGFSLAIIPAGSTTHHRFAAEAASYPDAFMKPTFGWIAGVHLEGLGGCVPVVYDGRTATKHKDRAVVAYVRVPADKLISLETINLFEAEEGDVIRFPNTGFHAAQCEVNGKSVDFASYVKERGLDHGRLPLVGDFAGARINVSIQGFPAQGGVDFYAPVFPDVDYRFAKPVDNYVEAFRSKLAEVDQTGVVWGCNCILNFLFGDLNGKKIGGTPGAVTFGEIAYQLLNQTMVMVRIS